MNKKKNPAAHSSKPNFFIPGKLYSFPENVSIGVRPGRAVISADGERELSCRLHAGDIFMVVESHGPETEWPYFDLKVLAGDDHPPGWISVSRWYTCDMWQVAQ